MQYKGVYACFKFQSDSINTITTKMLMDVLSAFKFQSDSINTVCLRHLHKNGLSLNSNLILLILIKASAFSMVLFVFKFQFDSINTLCFVMAERLGQVTLNSNLILLIRRDVCL